MAATETQTQIPVATAPDSYRDTPRKANFSPDFQKEVLHDYHTCCLSREASKMARKEVLNDRANFGIIGDGKELAQVAMAKAWRKGDWRSGYYRDQTLMLALNLMNLDEFFAQLYGDPLADKFSTGRQMNCHFATQLVDAQGNYTDHKNRYNISADIAPTGGQMARGLGLAFASKKFRENPALGGNFSDHGNEVAFVTIGDASTSEGAFWETMNAAGVLQVPLVVAVWDDGFGISVPQKYQTTKQSISEALAGFAGDPESGMDIVTVKAWDYTALVKTFADAAARSRALHRPVLVHVQEVTQQLGHSTSGDHRRYKSPERLQWELDFDCNQRFGQWILDNGLADKTQLETIQKEAETEAKAATRRAYNHYHEQIGMLRTELNSILENLRAAHSDAPALAPLAAELAEKMTPLRADILKTARQSLFAVTGKNSPAKNRLAALIERETEKGAVWYSKHLYSETEKSPLRVPVVPPIFSENSPLKNGYDVLNACFDANFERNPAVFAFGEDVGQIGDVNQGLVGMQKKYGEYRVFDTGIREWTIVGQAIGMAMRGLRPIAEIQYLDYLLYALSPLSDDLCTLRWRSAGQQAAPAIIRTRGHRLVGVWHSGSPMQMMLGSLRGMWFCVPRNMVQAAGMYNTLLRGDDPAIVVECLNGYRLKERMPDNVGEFTVPLGVPEILRSGTDITLISYGSTLRVADEACDLLADHGISVELIDVQTLMPFDLPKICVQSLQKTNGVAFLDEDFSGGATAYMMQEVLEKQGGYRWLDAPPLTIAAKPHRAAYGADGDYFSKPQVEDVFQEIFKLVREGETI